jgi:hypothetical protein
MHIEEFGEAIAIEEFKNVVGKSNTMLITEEGSP